MKLTIFDRSSKNEILENLPDVLKVLLDHLVITWTENDIARRDRMNADFEKMDRREFENRYSKKTYEFRHLTNRAIGKNVKKTAENFIFGVICRIKELCGNVTDWNGLHVEGSKLNGFVIGERGTVNVHANNFLFSRLHHNIAIDLVVQKKPKEEKHDLNYWLNQLDDAIEKNDLKELKRAKLAIKEIRILMGKGVKPDAEIQLHKVA